MAMLYITDESREQLEMLTAEEKRSLSDEMGFLIDKRFKELGLHSMKNISVTDNGITAQSECQG